ncbi:MAG: DinB family protein [Flavipsychrobacter sp.]
MKDYLIKLAKYNIWANKLFIKTLRSLTEEQLDTEMNSSFPTIRKTVYHMWSAEDIWLQRLALVERPIWAEGVFDGDFEAAIAKWEEASKSLLVFVEQKYNDSALTQVVQYYDLKKRSYKLPVTACLTQVFNHATYHRGQLVTMLRQVGVKKIPQTDFHVCMMK